MRALIASILIAVTAAVALAVVPYKTDQFYVWSDASVANSALNYINVVSGWLPYEDPETGYKMDNWMSEVLEREDGKFVFQRIPSALLTQFGIPPEEQQLFFTTFNPTIETYQDDWFPEEE